MVTESAVRKMARRHGYRVCKSRRQESLDNLADYMLIENNRNLVVLGSRFDATLEEIREYLTGRN
jgi:hypothetical protein